MKFKVGDKVVVIAKCYQNQQFQEGIIAYSDKNGVFVNLTKVNQGTNNSKEDYPNKNTIAPWNTYEDDDLEHYDIFHSPLYQAMLEEDDSDTMR